METGQDSEQPVQSQQRRKGGDKAKPRTDSVKVEAKEEEEVEAGHEEEFDHWNAEC